jgi:hypothetical protein
VSDFILKFWPKKEVKENKTESIREALKKQDVIGDEIKHWSGKSNKAKAGIKNFLEYDFEDDDSYSTSLVVKVSELDYGIKDGKKDIETFERKNVLSIYEGDGSIIGWSKLCEFLEQLTGDEYEGEWEIL